ncbi:hypothetical protein [Streptacidiphilus rugosus]|uniref:hypothetical protein n=1 Tax=Streptacidiphilus rugosus TaxID=405783 RepID=UPI0038CD86A3
MPVGPGASLPSTYRTTAHTMWPQGWSFFADEGDVDDVTALRPGDAGGAPANAAAVGNSWGLSRLPDAIYRQAVFVSGEVPMTRWVNCLARSVQSAAERCAALAKPVVALSNPFRPALLCGVYILVKGKPWVGLERQESLVSVVRLTCSR